MDTEKDSGDIREQLPDQRDDVSLREEAKIKYEQIQRSVQRAIDDAKLDADEVSLTASGSVLTGVAPKGFDAWTWLDEELQSALAGVVKSIALRDAKPQPAGARALDDAIRALEGVVAVRPSVGPALELLKKERRALK